MVFLVSETVVLWVWELAGADLQSKNKKTATVGVLKHLFGFASNPKGSPKRCFFPLAQYSCQYCNCPDRDSILVEMELRTV